MAKVTVPRGPYQKGIRRRREIVAAASRIFARYGYGGSLRQIANDVGVTPAALARHFGNKDGLLQAVLTHWEDETADFFDGAQGLEYFRRLPSFMDDHTTEPGLIELLLTLSTEATDPQHPAREWAVERYRRVINLGISYLREAVELGEVGPMDDKQIEVEARSVFALMDGIQLQWLLDPSLPLVSMFQAQLDTMIERWTRGAKGHGRRTRPSRLSAPTSPANPALTDAGPALTDARPALADARPALADARPALADARPALAEAGSQTDAAAVMEQGIGGSAGRA
jgi:AcrR family transcriptional regulator